MPNRKSGITKRREREKNRLLRDRKIYGFLQKTFDQRIAEYHRRNLNIKPLSVVLGDEGLPDDLWHQLSPVRYQENGKPMPHWNDLSKWMKLQVCIWLMANWKVHTFHNHIHRDLSAKWLAEDKDVRAMVRDRLRKEFAKVTVDHEGKTTSREFFFVIEAHSRRTKQATVLHIHGAAAIYDELDDEEENIRSAAGRAVGHGVRGFSPIPRAVKAIPYYNNGASFINYLYKFVRRKDDRLNEKRVTMSRSLVGAARSYWGSIVGHDGWYENQKS